MIMFQFNTICVCLINESFTNQRGCILKSGQGGQITTKKLCKQCSEKKNGCLISSVFG